MRTLYDLQVDGSAVLQLRDVTEVYSGENERFFEKVLRTEGRLADLDEPPPINLSSFKSVLGFLQRADPYVIIECEREVHEDGEGDFYLGEIVGLQEDCVRLSLIHVDGTSDPEEEDVEFEGITVVRFQEEYIQMFKKYSAWAKRSE